MKKGADILVVFRTGQRCAVCVCVHKELGPILRAPRFLFCIASFCSLSARRYFKSVATILKLFRNETARFAFATDIATCNSWPYLDHGTVWIVVAIGWQGRVMLRFWSARRVEAHVNANWWRGVSAKTESFFARAAAATPRECVD